MSDDGNTERSGMNEEDRLRSMSGDSGNGTDCSETAVEQLGTTRSGTHLISLRENSQKIFLNTHP